jgi:hypothetical protein
MKTKFTFSFFLLLFIFCFGQDKILIHHSTSSNIQGSMTFIDHYLLNNNPNAVFYVSHCRSCQPTNIENTKLNGVYFSNSLGKWAIFNEDASTMQSGISFFVYIPTHSIYQFKGFNNSNTNYINIDNPNLNNLDGKIIAAIHHSFGETFPHILGSTYDDGYERHRIFTEDLANFGSSEVNIMGIIDGEAGISAYRHYANFINIDGNATILDHPLLNEKPHARFVFTHYRNYITDDQYQTYLNKVLTAYYDSSISKWKIRTEDGSNLDQSYIFNIFVDQYPYMNTNEVKNENSIKIAPNPSKGMIQIETFEPIEKISVYDWTGKKVHENTFTNVQKTQLNLENLPKGTYLLSIKTKLNSYSEKLILQ